MKKLNIDDRIFLKHSGKLDLVRVEDISVISSLGNYCMVKTNTKKGIIVRKTLSGFEDVLPKNNFLRISRSTIVNLDRINKISRWSSGRYKVHIEEAEEDLIISQRYAAKIRKLLVF